LARPTLPPAHRSRGHGWEWRRAAGLAVVALALAAACSEAPEASGARGDAAGPSEQSERPEPVGQREQAAQAGQAEAAGTTVESGIEYGRGEVLAPAEGDVPLLLDLYRPAGEPVGGYPVVVLIHGGGFAAQSRTDAGVVEIARGLAERGIAAASIDYRLIGQRPVPSARVSALAQALPPSELSTGMAVAVDDTLTAVGYLTEHADDLGIDPDRLGMVGSSAGAMTADHVGYALDDHGIAGPHLTFVGSLWGGILVPPGVDQVAAGEPALFAVHGDADPTVPVRLSDELVARARHVGLDVDYHRIAGAGHGYSTSRFFTQPVEGTQTSFDRLLAFAEAALRSRG
jgi:acetyl esterase/lipase